MLASEVTTMNSFQFSDNFQIVKEAVGQCVGCEHNESEAKAIATYLTNYHGQNFIVVRNGVDLVRRARELRGGDVLRVKHRDDILTEMGVGR